MRISIYLLVMVCLWAGSGELALGQDLVAFCRNRFWGLGDSQGKVIYKAQWDVCQTVPATDLYVYKQNGAYMLLHTNGQIVFGPSKDPIRLVHKNYYTVFVDGFWEMRKVLDPSFRTVIESEVQLAESLVVFNGKKLSFLLFKNTAVMVESVCNSLLNVVRDPICTYYVMAGDSVCELFDTMGKRVFDAQFEQLSIMGNKNTLVQVFPKHESYGVGNEPIVLFRRLNSCVGSSAKKWVVCFDKQKLPLNITPSVVKGYEGGILACSATKSLIVSSLQGIKELNCLDIRYLGGGFFETLKREMGVVKGGGITSWTTRALYDETGKELYPYVKDSGFEWIKDTKLFFYNIGFLNKGVVNVWGEFLVEPVQEAKYLHFSPNFRLITIDSDGGTMGVMLDENFRLMDVQKFNAIARIRTTKEPDVYHWEQRINTAENTTEIGLFNQRKVEVLLNRFAESRSSLYNDTWAETIVHAEKSVYFTYKVKQLTGLVDMSRGVEILPAIQTYIKYDDMASYNFFRSWNRFDRMNLCSNEGKLWIANSRKIDLPLCGLIRYEKAKKWNLMDSLGHTLFKTDFQNIVIVDSTRFLAENASGWGLIDRNGKVLIPHKYQMLKQFMGADNLPSTNLYLNAQSENNWGVIDFTGIEILPFQYQNITHLRNSQTDYFAAKRNNVGLVDIHNRELIPFRFSRIENFAAPNQDAFACFTPSRKSGFLDRNGLHLNDSTYIDTKPFSESHAWIQYKPNAWVQINSKFKTVSDSTYHEVSFMCNNRAWVRQKYGRWLAVDSLGREVIPASYAGVNDFCNDLAIVRILKKNFWGKQKSKTGLITVNNTWFVPAKYKTIQATDDSIFVVRKKKWGIMALSGKLILKARFKKIIPLGIPKFYIVAKNNKKMGLFHTQRGWILEPKYRHIDSLGTNRYFAVLAKKKTHFLFDTSGVAITIPKVGDLGPNNSEYYSYLDRDNNKWYCGMYADPQQKILLPTRPTRIDDTTVVYDSRRKKELFNLKNQQSFWLVPNVVISPVQLASGLGFAKSGNTFSFYNAHAQKLWGTNFADIRRLDSALFVVQPKPNQFQIWNTFGTPINHHKYSKLAFSPEKKSVAFKQAEVFEVFNSKGQLLTHEKCFARTPYTTTLTEISFYNRTAFFNTKNELFEYE